jgi:hypothetical protein
LALLGALALQAFRNASGQPQETLQLDHAAKLAAGLRAPDNEQEEQEIQAVAKLIVRAMVNAAKADGHIDESEMKRITGNLEKDGIRGQERELVAAELRKPLDTDSLVRAVRRPPLRSMRPPCWRSIWTRTARSSTWRIWLEGWHWTPTSSAICTAQSGRREIVERNWTKVASLPWITGVFY